MRLLICTQAVDTDDPVLGFFCRWIEEFAKHAEHVEVICLKEGKHALPENVRVHSLGKPASQFRYVWNLYRYIFSLKHDVVFVHMNPEYVVLGGLFWRLLGKRIALWYTHKSINLKLRIAAFLSNVIFTASKESFRLPSGKVRVMGHGIDTDFFSPNASVARGDWMLSVGRLMSSKRHDLAVRAAALAGKELRVVGDGPEREHLEALAKELGASVRFLGGLTQVQLRDEYRQAATFIHTSETGSLDKVVLEALACGLPIHTDNPSLKPLENAAPAYVREQHSLQKLIPAIIRALS